MVNFHSMLRDITKSIALATVLTLGVSSADASLIPNPRSHIQNCNFLNEAKVALVNAKKSIAEKDLPSALYYILSARSDLGKVSNKFFREIKQLSLAIDLVELEAELLRLDQEINVLLKQSQAK